MEVYTKEYDEDREMTTVFGNVEGIGDSGQSHFSVMMGLEANWKGLKNEWKMRN